jgi:transcriptional regulator of acetoin/glycerol metabolism
VDIARRIANSTISVLIQGPTGSGKDAFARALHLASARAEEPFIALNCAAIPESLIESELFGYKSGAFTGACKTGMRGKVLQASGGTLFLDEIGDMPLTLQTRLLRVLEEHEVVPLGSETPIAVDLRVICATHRDLRGMIARGEFREDLYFRLGGITLELPALAQRSDLFRLIHDFLAAESRGTHQIAIDADAMRCLLGHSWPGNLRELRNVIRAALAVSDGEAVRLHDLPRAVRDLPPLATVPSMDAKAGPSDAGSQNPLKAAERAALMRVIEGNRWNMSRTAHQLGISRGTLYRKLKSHSIPVAPAVGLPGPDAERTS